MQAKHKQLDFSAHALPIVPAALTLIGGVSAAGTGYAGYDTPPTSVSTAGTRRS
jgi:hypothetical protein